MTVFVGTSGWQYASWRERFYPKDVAQARWLEFFAERFQIVEINNTFYRLPPPTTFEGWHRRTPADFVLAPKLSRYLTHIKRLKDPEEPVTRFLQHAAPLREKVGPLLLQLPPKFPADLGRLDDTLSRFPRHLRVCVEFRDASWWTDDARRVLERRGAALCLPDRHNRLLGPSWRTADWAYIRFHEGLADPHPCYEEAHLEYWARRLADEYGPDADLYVFFNNDPLGCAVRDAAVFARACSEAGLRPTRVPSLAEVSVG